MAKMTAKMVEAVRPTEVRQEIPDALLPGLYLVVQPSGVKSWAYRFRSSGRTAKATLGRYPALGLAEARQAAAAAARRVATGGNPTEEKKAARREQEAKARDTVAAQVDDYFRRHLSGLRSGDAALGFLRRGPVAAWGDRGIASITKRDVVDLLDTMVDRGSPIAANRTLAHIRAFFTWAVDRDVVVRSPAEAVRAPVAERSRDRVLTDAEIGVFWNAAVAQGQPFGHVHRLLLLTGQRLREVAGMNEREIAGSVWTIPGDRAKNGVPHHVPLSKPALEIIRDLKRLESSTLYFTTTGKTPVSGFQRAKANLDQLMAKAADEPVPPFVIHDLRRTAASGMARLGVAPHVIEAVLNHRSGVVSGVAAVYNRADYLREKRAALDGWARHIHKLVGDRPTNVVVTLPRPR